MIKTIKHLKIFYVSRGFIVKFMHDDLEIKTAVYVSLTSDDFYQDTEEFFRDRTKEELAELEKKAKKPVKK